MVGRAYGIPTVALRFFNVYGPRQALSNPYTGVLAIFAARLLNDRPPLIFEDGQQRATSSACATSPAPAVLALEGRGGAAQVFNVGSGAACTVREIAARLAQVLGRDIGAGDHRQVPRRRHPSLLRGHHAARRGARLPPACRSRRGSPSSPTGWPQARAITWWPRASSRRGLAV